MILRMVWVVLLLAQSVCAQTSSFDFQATVSFDPSRVVSNSGGTLGALLTEFAGPGAATGQIVVPGKIAYTPSQVPTISSPNIGIYQRAITDVQFTLGASTFRLNMPFVLANAATSKIGFILRSDQMFCGDFEHCQQMGLRNAPFGAQAIVYNNINNALFDETGTTQFVRNDLFGFMAGRTDAVGEFEPIFQTQGFGTISVDGFAFGLFSRDGTDFFDSRNLPPVSVLVGTPNIQRSEFWFYLEGPQLFEKVKVEGVVNQIVPIE